MSTHTPEYQILTLGWINSYQPNPTTQAIFTAQWIRMIVSYAQHKRLFYMLLNDAVNPDSGWYHILGNERINRKSIVPQFTLSSSINFAPGRIKITYLSRLFDIMIENRQATYWPLTGQRDQLLIFWRSPEEWGELVFDYVRGYVVLSSMSTDLMTRLSRCPQ